MRDKELLERMSQNSKDHNIRCLVEEMAELTQALLKDLRGKSDRDNIAEEMSDVLMMLQVTQKCLGIPAKDIFEWSKRKEANLRNWYLVQGKGEQYEPESNEKGDR